MSDGGESNSVCFDESWVPASKALKLVERQLGGSVQAKDILADQLRDGHVRSAARRGWISDEHTIVAAWKGQPAVDDETLEHDVELPALTWRSSKRWASDQMEWRWPVDKFSITETLKPRWIHLYEGVHFFLNDVMALIASNDDDSQIASRRGAKRDELKWRSFWHAVIDLEREDRLNRDIFSSQAELSLEIRENMGFAFGERAIRTDVRMIWDKYVKDQRQRSSG
ncbi:hypothetical protein sphantq_01973 [Sphingobium sp. AntQ-1]|uniref:hypothetical protein n=1 Tax=Sphingobium sp. AntQ-1 TaxID=2930091 RepID=UPI00234E830A|nr:hypothetical protein [Sphingobium sp. AntQ-1]WCP13544.1 hypothetical protein sphantq_01973 [Sphingobium sp. AntQ-1]